MEGLGGNADRRERLVTETKIHYNKRNNFLCDRDLLCEVKKNQFLQLHL